MSLLIKEKSESSRPQEVSLDIHLHDLQLVSLGSLLSWNPHVGRVEKLPEYMHCCLVVLVGQNAAEKSI